MKKTILFITLATSIFCEAQEQVSQSMKAPPRSIYSNIANPIYNSELGSENFWRKMIDNKKERAKHFEGKLYMFDDFITAKIGNIPQSFRANYNLVTDEVEFFVDDDVYAVRKIDLYNKIEFV